LQSQYRISKNVSAFSLLRTAGFAVHRGHFKIRIFSLGRQAKRDSAQILFWDESGFRADTPFMERSRGLRGQTPLGYRSGQRLTGDN
jgi:hypothetical protein